MNLTFKLNFIGVGASKSGTTWLARCLGEHPKVCISQPKELNYFCKKMLWTKRTSNNLEGERWLHARFNHCQHGSIKGEFSPVYLFDPNSPHLIKNHNRDIRLIFAYRNPTDRIYSLYFQFAKEYSVPGTFEEFIVRFPQAIESGYYYAQTKRYLDNFPLRNMYFILYDDICEDPKSVLQNLFQFLEVDETYTPKSVQSKINVRKIPRYPSIRNFISNATDFLNATRKRIKLKKVLRGFELHRFADWLITKNLRVTKFPPMRPETRARLISLYAEENQALADLLERDLSHWND